MPDRQPWKPVVLRLVNGRYETASAAVAFGSPVRGESKEHADIDLVVVGAIDGAPFREALVFEGWPLEVHVHTVESLWDECSRDASARRALLPYVFVNGEMLFDRDGKGGTLRSRLTSLLESGPPPLTDQERTVFRLRITDGISDLSDPRPLGEVLFSAARLVHAMAELTLAAGESWVGQGKALYRNLEALDAGIAERLATAWAGVADDPGPLVTLADELLEPHGGRLFES
jgi:hypothetical protein